MAIGSAGKKVSIVTPAYKVGSRTSDEVKFTERPTTQQKSYIQEEQEKEERIVEDLAQRVYKGFRETEEREEQRVKKTNKLWEEVLQIHRVEIYEDNGKSKERYVPQSKFIFNNDSEYNNWLMNGSMDKYLNPEFDYIVLRRIIAKEV